MGRIELALAVVFAIFVACLPAYADTTQRQQDYHKCVEEKSKTGNLASAKSSCCQDVGGTWVEVEGEHSIRDSGCTVSDEAMPVSPTDPRKPKDPLRGSVGPRPETTDPGETPTQPVDPGLRQKVLPSANTATP